ncbi:hypothetical protein FA15DRAFT_493095 [Coprinopsis marcescibilis]|uniref:Uncharacterized protein n=1 Tax=Coprinopsis marcescibilis TaxID=230819 RepID=A0A5C3KRE7_COPMA|nr:hypothetical protein FA15DRAFT_493095 [Coprinopsis marcescibilis]
MGYDSGMACGTSLWAQMDCQKSHLRICNTPVVYQKVKVFSGEWTISENETWTCHICLTARRGNEAGSTILETSSSRNTRLFEMEGGWPTEIVIPSQTAAAAELEDDPSFGISRFTVCGGCKCRTGEPSHTFTAFRFMLYYALVFAAPTNGFLGVGMINSRTEQSFLLSLKSF